MKTLVLPVFTNVIYIGTNGKMNEAFGRHGLTIWKAWMNLCRQSQNYEYYNSCLKDIPGIKLHQYDDHEKQNCQYIILEVDEPGTGLSRDEIFARFRTLKCFSPALLLSRLSSHGTIPISIS